MLDKCLRTHSPNKLPFCQSLNWNAPQNNLTQKRASSLTPSPQKKSLSPNYFTAKKDAKNAKVFFSSLCFFLTFSISIVGLMVGAYRLGGVRLMCTRRGMGIWAARNQISVERSILRQQYISERLRQTPHTWQVSTQASIGDWNFYTSKWSTLAIWWVQGLTYMPETIVGRLLHLPPHPSRETGLWERISWWRCHQSEIDPPNIGENMPCSER